MKKIFACFMTVLALVAGPVQAAGGGMVWDKFPTSKLNDVASLQRGAKLFVNHCLNCHSAAFMRYNRMGDLDLTDAQIKANLMFATDKVGETMKVAMDPKQAKAWFGATPPDLTVIARSRAGAGGSGADYLYTYLRTYYRDSTKATGWNNLAFPSVGMPNPLWELQGQRTASFIESKDPHDASRTVHAFGGFEQVTQGTMNAGEFDSAVGDLVAYVTWMGEPAAKKRWGLGVLVMLFLSIATLFAWRLNAAYWKDIK